jgi:magnesium transporter
MISKYTYKTLTWIDIEAPTKDEVFSVMNEYNIHPLVADELLSPTLRPKVDVYENLIYLILHFPTISHKHGEHPEQEIDFIIGKDILITTHYNIVDPLHEFSKIFEVNSILEKSNIAEHGGFLFFYLMREIYKGLNDELDYIYNTLERIESKIFKGEEVEMVEKISIIGRDILDFKQALRPHKEVLESFEVAGEKFFGKGFSYYLRDISGEYYKIYNLLEGHRETLEELRETNDSLLTTKTNETMRTFTVIAALALPAAIMASIFGMNAKSMPFIGMPNDFWLIMLLIIVFTILLFLFFKYKKWL